jgi:hypothetical protein
LNPKYSHGTATNTTARPRLAIIMYTTKPTAVPLNEISPAARPWLMLRDTRYNMFGPGVSTMPNAVSTMPAVAAIEISTPETLPAGQRSSIAS